jgi:ABC-type uncharacterized transport system fused permease/ATPase subunit
VVLFIYGFWLNWFLAVFVIGVLAAGTVVFAFQSSAVGKATLPVQNCEGKLRYWHLRIRDYAESICFYQGEQTEAQRVNELLLDVYNARMKQLKVYVPVLVVGNIFGYFQVIGVLLALNYGALYMPELNISANDYGTMQAFFFTFGIRIGVFGACLSACGIVVGLVHRVGVLMEACEKHKDYANQIDAEACSNDDVMGMDKVTVATPNGMKLIEDLSFQAQKGESLIIMGQSGCGKSSLLRLLSGLWKTRAGTVTRPLASVDGGFLFLPQKSYVTQGTFLEVQ